MKECVVNMVNECDQLSISFHNLCYTVKAPDKVEILRDLCGNFTAGRLCAIVGPTGAGKTSLLNILSGFKKPTRDGCLFINGKNASGGFIRENSSYIAQETAFLRKLTIKETLNIAAKLKLPAGTPKSLRRTIIDNIVQLLSLEKCLNTREEKLSGGERKRLSIGEELITNPPIMIFDEPTSGLDSVSAVQVVSHLRDLAHSGRTIICVIHQPSSFMLEIFDDIYVLANGQCLYCGPVDEIVPEFNAAGFVCPQYYNRADFILEVTTLQRKGNLDHLIKKVKEKDWTALMPFDTPETIIEKTALNNNVESIYESTENFSYPISQWQQFCILLSRSFLCNRREFVATQLKFFMHAITALVFGLVFYDIGNDANKVLTNVSLIFILMFSVFFGNALPIILLYPSEAKIFYKEYLNNRYAFLPYFYAKILADLPILVVCTFVTVLPVYFLTSQPIELYRIFLISVMFFLLSIISLFYGFVIGIVFSAQLGIIFLPASCLLMLVFCGFFMRYNEMSWIIKPFSYLSLFRYLYEGIFQSIYGFDRENLNCSALFCYFKSLSKILEQMDMEENNYALDIVGLIVWIVFLKLVAYAALKMKVKKMLK